MINLFLLTVISAYCFRILWVATQIGKLNTLLHTYNILIGEQEYPNSPSGKMLDYDTDVVNLADGVFDLTLWKTRDFYKRRSPSFVEVRTVVYNAGNLTDAKIY